MTSADLSVAEKKVSRERTLVRRREIQLARLRREYQGGAIAGVLFLGVAGFSAAKGNPGLAVGNVVTFVLMEVVAYTRWLRGRLRLAEEALAAFARDGRSSTPSVE